MKKVWMAVALAMIVPGAVFAENADPKTVVYAANTLGSTRYHQGFCPKVNRGFGKISYTLQEALDKGYTPCPKCHPPEGITHRYEEQKTRIGKSKPETSASLFSGGVGDSAADIERDPDGTVVGHGGGFAATADSDSSSVDTNLSAHEEIGEYRLLAFDVRLIERNEGQDRFDFLFRLKNLSSGENTINVTVVGVDPGGNAIASTTFDCTLAGSVTDICQRTGSVRSELTAQIARWAAQ